MTRRQHRQVLTVNTSPQPSKILTLGDYIGHLAELRRIEPVLADAWFDALTAALMELFEPESLSERALGASWTSR